MTTQELHGLGQQAQRISLKLTLIEKLVLVLTPKSCKAKLTLRILRQKLSSEYNDCGIYQ